MSGVDEIQTAEHEVKRLPAASTHVCAQPVGTRLEMLCYCAVPFIELSLHSRRVLNIIRATL